MSFENAFSEIKVLVKNFKDNEKFYLSTQYQEQEVRRDFIDKFFIVLGWDVLHETQKNPYEQEVKVERGVLVSGAQKRADYSFSLNPNFRDPKFFVEAKKPFHDLTNKDYYFQTIRYGWHKNTPIVVLTDFEEFHILDCRFSPDINSILSRKIKKFHYSEYCESEKFSEIYWLFSRESVQNNSIEKFSEDLPKPKGKAYQKALFAFEKHLTIDEAFLEEIDGIREKLAKAFKKNDESLKSDELTEATQRTIDRLVFIRFLEDKLIEQTHYVSSFGEKGNSWDDFLSICIKLDTKYNGIVFKKIFIDNNSFKGPSDHEFHLICQDICHLNSRFLYNEIPIHILGSIYERFLGKVVHSTGKRVTIEEKPEVRKAGGVYYTPKYIVDYIVQNTVGKLIQGKTPEQISKLKFADISCGSGSFLIGVLDCLLTYHNKYYQEHSEKAKKDGCLNKEGIWVMSIKQKQNILRNNIYGVDIDTQAVEVTQLSLFLKMLEDETTATANDMQVLFHERILPDMSKNIICGNSLVGTDILTQNLFEGVEEKKLNPLNFYGAFPLVMSKGGFDVILGNPPWGVEFDEISLKYLRKTNSKIIVRMIDSFMYFIYKGFCLLKKEGIFGMIVPDVLLYQVDNTKLREFIIRNTNIEEILNLGDVFKKVVRPTCILVFKKDEIKSKNKIITIDLSTVKKEEKNNSLLEKENYQSVLQNDLLELPGFLFVTNNIHHYSILRKINKGLVKRLVEYVDDDGIQRGVSPDLKEAFIINDNILKEYNLEKDYIREVITGGKEVKRFCINQQGKKLIYTKTGDNFKGIPNICSYIDQYKSKITCKEVKTNKHSLYSLHRSRNENIFLKNVKIVGVITEDEIVTAIDENGLFATDGIYLFGVREINYRFLVGLLNSKLLSFLYRLLSMEKGRVLAQVKPTVLNEIPIKVIDFNNKVEKSNHDLIVNLVCQMEQSIKHLQISKTEKDRDYYERKCSDINFQLDKIVYQLYNLSDDEISIVENINKGTSPG